MFQRIMACVVAVTVATASVFDNTAACREDVFSQDVPSMPSGCCAGMPCQTPGKQQAPTMRWPTFALERTLLPDCPEPDSAEAPAPPTPPPTLGV